MQNRQCCLLVLLSIATSLALAQSIGGPYRIGKATIDSGGGRATGGQFRLTGTIGQPDAARQPAQGGPFRLTGGFWAKGSAPNPGGLIFADDFEG